MKVLVLGGDGRSGRLLAKLARDAGHEVTVLCRRYPRPSLAHIRIIEGDARDHGVVNAAVVGQDVVVHTLGSRKPRHRTTLEAEAMRCVVEAMHRHGVRRLVAVSLLGVSDGQTALPMGLRLRLRMQLPGMLVDKAAMEAIVRASRLDWTIVQAARLTDGPRTESVSMADAASSQGAGSLARADLAALLLQVLGDSASIGQTLCIVKH